MFRLLWRPDCTTKATAASNSLVTKSGKNPHPCSTPFLPVHAQLQLPFHAIPLSPFLLMSLGTGRGDVLAAATVLGGAPEPPLPCCSWGCGERLCGELGLAGDSHSGREVGLFPPPLCSALAHEHREGENTPAMAPPSSEPSSPSNFSLQPKLEWSGSIWVVVASGSPLLVPRGISIAGVGEHRCH